MISIILQPTPLLTQIANRQHRNQPGRPTLRHIVWPAAAAVGAGPAGRSATGDRSVPAIGVAISPAAAAAAGWVCCRPGPELGVTDELCSDG